MNEVKLTRDADALICVLYKEYIQRRKKSIPKQKACDFGGSPNIHEKLMPKWSFEDVDETCRELSRAGLLKCLFADDIAYHAVLTDSAIVYMENRFKDGFASLLHHLKELMALIPWGATI